jgi:mono/diheme cytochrome c family protein
MRTAVVLAVALAVTALGACGGAGTSDPAAAGEALFRGSGACATCHGPNLEGTSMGPSLLDVRYHQPDFDDASIRAAVREGVPDGSLGFGVMPALGHLDDDDIEHLIAYVRSAQRQAEGSAP